MKKKKNPGKKKKTKEKMREKIKPKETGIQNTDVKCKMMSF